MGLVVPLFDNCPVSCGLCKSKVVVSGTSEGPKVRSSRRLIMRGSTIQSVVGLNFWDNDESASTLCRLSGYRQGGIVVRTNATYVKDAMPIGSATQAKTVTVAPQEETHGDFSYREGACAAGPPVGVEVVCTKQVKIMVDCGCSLLLSPPSPHFYILICMSSVKPSTTTNLWVCVDHT